MEKHNLEINIGVSEENRKINAEGLSRLLADTYILYLKTQNFHWNVKGPQFASLHLLFESQYQELALANDVIAESIRALGVRVAASFAEYSKITSIKENTEELNAKEMILQLIDGQQQVIHTARRAIEKSEATLDRVTTDLLIQCVRQHEKAAWMLRSLLES